MRAMDRSHRTVGSSNAIKFERSLRLNIIEKEGIKQYTYVWNNLTLENSVGKMLKLKACGLEFIE